MEKFLLSDVLSFFVRRNCVHQLFVMNGFVVAHSLELCFAVGFAECMLVVWRCRQDNPGGDWIVAAYR